MKEQPGSEPPRRGSTVPVLSGLAALLLVATLIVPGYIAGFYCRIAHDWNSGIPIGTSGDLSTPPNIGLRVFLAPAALAEKIAPRLQEIYWKQFMTGSEVTFNRPTTWSAISAGGVGKPFSLPPTATPIPSVKPTPP